VTVRIPFRVDDATTGAAFFRNVAVKHLTRLGTFLSSRVPIALGLAVAAAVPAKAANMPRYEHIFIIIEENHSADEIIGDPSAPAITKRAKGYGLASQFYAERHPSEPNYVALVGGDTFGIADDDAFYCRPGLAQFGCAKSSRAGYVDHTVAKPNLASQLDAHGISWKGYFESIPEPGSGAYRWPSTQHPISGQPEGLYAAKHNGFITFKSVQDDPKRKQKIVGFDALDRDIASGTLPAFAIIVPNQCNDMHGLHGNDVPADCAGSNQKGLVARGDRVVGSLADKIMGSAAWTGAGNSAIVITFDENDDDRPDKHPPGCCGTGASDPNNPGGGWIPTVVITNHGPRGLDDPTPYNHYSLLRTVETAFGMNEYLGHAADSGHGVVAMAPLFATSH
jgi:phospholipase C